MTVNTFWGNESSKNNFLIISGVHGNEITPLGTHQLLLQKIRECEANYNKVTLLYGVNESGLLHGTREMVSSGTNDLNRSFSTIEEDCEGKIKDYVSQCNVVIDIHSSPYLSSEMFLLDIDERLGIYQSFLRSLDIPYCQRYSVGGTIKNYVNSFPDKAGFTLELNGTDVIDFDSAKKGCDIILKFINNFSKIGDVELGVADDREVFTIKAMKTGLFMLNKWTTKDIIRKGDLIGFICDHEGKILQTVRSPYDMKIVCGKRTGFYIGAGQDLFECMHV